MATKGSTFLERNTTTGRFLVDLPRDVREKTGLKDGDAIVLTTTPDGRIILRPKSGSLKDLRGVSATKIKADDRTIREALSGRRTSITSLKAAKTR